MHGREYVTVIKKWPIRLGREVAGGMASNYLPEHLSGMMHLLKDMRSSIGSAIMDFGENYAHRIAAWGRDVSIHHEMWEQSISAQVLPYFVRDHASVFNLETINRVYENDARLFFRDLTQLFGSNHAYMDLYTVAGMDVTRIEFLPAWIPFLSDYGLIGAFGFRLENAAKEIPSIEASSITSQSLEAVIDKCFSDSEFIGDNTKHRCPVRPQVQKYLAMCIVLNLGLGQLGLFKKDGTCIPLLTPETSDFRDPGDMQAQFDQIVQNLLPK